MGRHFLLPFHKDGPVSPLLKEVIKEALKLLPLVYGQLKRMSVRNLPDQSGILEHTSRSLSSFHRKFLLQHG